MSSPIVRVGIVSWNTADYLDRCLAALPAALDGRPAEIVVVDNASSDDSVAVAQRHSGVTVIENADNRGYAVGMNQALAGSSAPVLIALNPDTEPGPGSLSTLIDRLLADASTGLIAPRLVNTDGSLQHSVYRFPSLRVAAVVCLLPQRIFKGRVGERFWLEGFSPHDKSGPVDWAIGAVHCIRAEAAADPVYTERWFMYAEDVDVCWQMHRRGWRVMFAADVTIPHRSNAAGEQAWGAQRMARWLDVTYRWYADERGPVQARIWAAINTFGVGVKLVANAVLVRVVPFGRAERGGLAALFRAFLPLHAKKLLRGPYASLVEPR